MISLKNIYKVPLNTFTLPALALVISLAGYAWVFEIRGSNKEKVCEAEVSVSVINDADFNYWASRGFKRKNRRSRGYMYKNVPCDAYGNPVFVEDLRPECP